MARTFIQGVLRLPLRNEKAPRGSATERRQERDRRRAARRARPARVDTTTRALAWGVHLYTAMGLVCAAGIAAVLVGGAPSAFRWSFLLMALATFIDATDGTLARKVRIKEVLPGFDGRKLDDITDFLTYTALPLVLVWRAGLLPAGTEWTLVLPLLASAYGFCQCAAKTDDGYFLGFPSLWNVVAFYLYALPLPAWSALAAILVLAFLTFVPSKYLYPTQPGRLNVVAAALGAVWVVMLVPVLWRLPAPEVLRAGAAGQSFMTLVWASLFYPAFYMGASFWVTLRLRRRRPVVRAAEATPSA